MPWSCNIDLAPTFAEIAGVEAPEFVDGRFFLPLLQDPQRPWRESFLIERRKLEERKRPVSGACSVTAVLG